MAGFFLIVKINMKSLLVLRHAKSSWNNTNLADFERPLKKRGKRDAPRMGALLKEEDIVPDLASDPTEDTTDMLVIDIIHDLATDPTEDTTDMPAVDIVHDLVSDTTEDATDLIIYDTNAPQEKEIVDLSLGGISFVYVDISKRLDAVFELDLTIGHDYHLGKVRAKIASDTVVGEITTKSQKIRRLRARFINLSALQEYELNRILKRYGR